MRKWFLTIILAASSAFISEAQNANSMIVGKVLEEDSSQPAVQAVVQVLAPKDSSTLEATVTDLNGEFSIRIKPGDYILKFSTLGYSPFFTDIHHTLSSNGDNIGTIQLKPESIVLNSSTVSAKAVLTRVVADTVVYNAAALNVAEDATLEELLKKIPGMSVSNNGHITLHGKDIKRLYINGQRFFGDNIALGLKSLDAEMIENIKAYERDSDFTRITGIEDGEKDSVLDLTVKKHMMDGWRGNVTGAGGTEERYTGKLSANKITKVEQTTVSATRFNLPSKPSFGNIADNRVGSGSIGERTYTSGGVNFSKKTKTLEINATAQVADTRRNIDVLQGNSETINASGISSAQYTKNTFQNDGNVKAEMKLEWRPNSRITLNVRPSFQFNYTNRESSQNTDNFNSSAKKSNWQEDFQNYAYRRYLGSIATIFNYRSKSKRGRSIGARVDLNYQDIGSGLDRDIHTHYLLIKKNPDSTRVINYHQDSPDRYFREYFQLSYNEPLGKNFYFQAYVGINLMQYSSERVVFRDGNPQPRSDLSFTGTNDYHSYTLTALVRYAKKKFGWSAGVKLNPQSTFLRYEQEGKWNSRKTSVFNAGPDLNLYYNKSKNQKLNFRYYTNSWTTSLYNLIPLENGVEGVSIHRGNAELKPAFRHNASLSYNVSNMKKQNSFLINGTFNITQNSITTSSEFDEETGARINVPKNISGSWTARLNLNYNKTFLNDHFSISNQTTSGYDNTQNLLYNNKLKADELNVVGRFIVRENLSFSYRNKWFEWIINAGGDFTNEHSRLRPDMDQRPYNIMGGTSLSFTLPWGMRINSDFSTQMQRGYKFGDFNDNYYYLNADISQSFFKKRLTIKIEGFDLLNMNMNLTRSFSAASRNIIQYGGTGRYVLLRAIYRFKL